MDWSPSPQNFDRVVSVTLELHHAFGSQPFQGDVFIDHIRLGDFQETPESPAASRWTLR
jgi:hypothetical protein